MAEDIVEGVLITDNPSRFIIHKKDHLNEIFNPTIQTTIRITITQMTIINHNINQHNSQTLTVFI